MVSTSVSRPAPHGPGRSLRRLLLALPLCDELTIGLLVVGLPLLRDRLHLSYAQVGLLFTAGEVSALLIDPLLNLLTDRRSKRRPVLAGLLLLTLSFALTGAAPGFPWLLVAFVVLFPANSAAVGLAQLALVELDTAAAPVLLARWTLSSGIGDLAAPAAVALLTGAGLGWPALCFIAAGCWLLLLVVAVPQRFPAPALQPLAVDGEEATSTLSALRLVARDGALLRWAGVELCAAMLDEVFLAFTALDLHDRLGAAPATVGFALLPAAVGAVASLLLLERLLRRVSGVRLLPACALLTLAGEIVLLLTVRTWVAAAALTAIAVGAAAWYPIARAAAYDRYPGRAGLVSTVLGVVAPVQLALPGVIGLVAAQAGTRAALAVLGVAPLIVLLIAPRIGQVASA